LDTVNVPITCDHATFGFDVGECHIRNRAYINGIQPHTSISKLRNFRTKYVGAFITQIHTYRVYDVTDVTDAFQSIRRDQSLTAFDIILAPDRHIPNRDRRDHVTMNVSHLRHITSILHPSTLVDNAITDDDIAFHLRSVHLPLNTPLTPEELAYNEKYTRRKLKLLPTWTLWKTAEKQQLGKMNLQGMFGSRCSSSFDMAIYIQRWCSKSP
jgi:hypothetical protein